MPEDNHYIQGLEDYIRKGEPPRAKFALDLLAKCKNCIIEDITMLHMLSTIHVLSIILLLLVLPFVAEAQTKRALLIGISDYGANVANTCDGQWENIHGANDVELLAPTLQKKRFISQQRQQQKKS